MTLAKYVMHVPGHNDRARSLAALLERAPGTHVMSDCERRGAWWNARRCWTAGLLDECRDPGSTHVVVMNDDALPCVDFERVAHEALAARPDDIVCFYANDDRAGAVHQYGRAWYSTVDGLVGVACAMPRALIDEFLAFCDEAIAPDAQITDDGRINLFAMATGRRILTTVPSLVDHQLPDVSMVGNETHEHRRAVVPPLDDMSAIDWTTEPVHLGRHYRGNHWGLLLHLRPEAWRKFRAVERAYALHAER